MNEPKFRVIWTDLKNGEFHEVKLSDIDAAIHLRTQAEKDYQCRVLITDEKGINLNLYNF